jgi:hypothetical protein
MRWSHDPPARYTVRYEWPARGRQHASRVRSLIADTMEDAKLEAAVLFACIEWPTLPTAYRIVRGARRVVYRYPEAAAARR